MSNNTLIMIADDNKEMRELVKRTLEEMEFSEFIEVENGKDAVATAKQRNPDVIIMDIGMPEMDGIAAATIIMKSNPYCRIIMLTGEPRPSRVTDSMTAGAVNFVLKPFKAGALKAVIRKAIQR